MLETDRERNKKNEIQAHFVKLGLKFGLTQKVIVRKLEKTMGAERFEKFRNLVEERKTGLSDSSDLYAFMRSPQEANLLLSLQSQALLEISAWIDSMVTSVVRPGFRIGELGCATGTLVSWLASEHSNCTVIGVDQVESFIRAARSSVRLPNSSFELWDYSTPKPETIEPFDMLVSSFGIDFPHGKPRAGIEPDLFRLGTRYEIHKSFAVRFLSRWREAARERSHLFAVLRISSFSQFQGVVDAACETGWAFERESIQILVGHERFTALSLLASPSNLPKEADLTAFWNRVSI